MDDSDAYKGRRRWPEPVRRRLFFGLTALAVSLLVVGGLALGLPEELRGPSGSLGPGGAAGAGGSIAGQLEPGVLPSDGTGRSVAPGGPAQTIPVVPSQVRPSGPGQGSPGLASSPAAPPFTSTQIEAEDARNIIAGGAQRVSYDTASGGMLVRDIGSPPGGITGTLTIPVAVPAAGQYNLLVRFAIPEGPATLTLVVAAAGAAPVAISVTGRSLCCSNRSVAVALQPGANWITFGNPDDRAPAIDFIQLTRPK